MTRRSPGRPPAAREQLPAESGGGLGGMLRGSVTSVVGATGVNVLPRAVERLTRAIERATVMLERLDRATEQLDEIDADFMERINQTLGTLARMGADTRAIRKRMDSMEVEMRELRTVVTQRLDRVPLLRARRRDRHTVKDAGPTTRASS